MEIEAAIFDLDGTLIDSVPAYFKITDLILERVNLPPVSREVVVELMKGGREIWDRLIPRDMMHRKDELIRRCMEVGMEIYPKVFFNEVDLIPGVAEIFSQLTANEIKIGLVTSSHARYVDGKLIPLKRNGIYELIDVMITIEDAPKMKPAPDPLIECARRLGVARERSVYVGDSRVDIRAAKEAGMFAIGVLTGIDDQQTLRREDPHMIVESIYALKEFFLKHQLTDGR